METKHTKSELLYIEEHQSCQNYMTTIETGFKYLEFAKNAAFEEDNTTKNYLLFFLKGDFTICCNQFHNKLFHAGEMILIPRSSRLKGFAETDSSLLSMFFDIPAENCDKLILQSLSNVCNNIEYDFSPIKIRYPLSTNTISRGINSLHQKRNELRTLTRADATRVFLSFTRVL